jgi:hypothetical protein
MTTKRRHNNPNAGSVADTAVCPSLKAREVPSLTPIAAPVITSLGVLFAHVTWSFAGPLAMFLALLFIVKAGTGWASVVDAAFFVLVGLTVWSRWYDQRSGQATTSYGEHSTWADCRRYMLWMPLTASAAWIVANVIGNRF